MQDGLFVEDIETWMIVYVSVGDCKVRNEAYFQKHFTPK